MKLLYISHYAYWYYLAQVEEKYKDCKGDYFADETTNIQKKATRYYDDYDYILYFSANYKKQSEIDKLITLAESIAKEKGKRVTIGYSYVIPTDQRINENIFCSVELISVKEDKIDRELLKGEQLKPKFNPMDLMEFVNHKHEELEHQKQKKK